MASPICSVLRGCSSSLVVLRSGTVNKSNCLNSYKNSTQNSIPILYKSYSTKAATKEAPTSTKLRIVAAAIVERVPVVLPEIPEFEKEYLRFCEKRDALMEVEQASAAQKRVDEEMKLRAKKEKGSGKKKDAKSAEADKKKKDDKEDENEEQKAKELLDYPRITDADKRNDRKSLYRALENRLYLIVKKKRDSNAWSFPQGGYEKEDGDHLRTTAERELKEECGALMNTFFIGNAPLGCYQYPIPRELQKNYGQAEKTRVFFYKARYLRGPVRLNNAEVTDHLWVTKSELKDYLDPEYYTYMKEVLMD